MNDTKCLTPNRSITCITFLEPLRQLANSYLSHLSFKNVFVRIGPIQGKYNLPTIDLKQQTLIQSDTSTSVHGGLHVAKSHQMQIPGLRVPLIDHVFKAGS